MSNAGFDAADKAGDLGNAVAASGVRIANVTSKTVSAAVSGARSAGFPVANMPTGVVRRMAAVNLSTTRRAHAKIRAATARFR